MEGHCWTGQSPQWAVVPMEEEEEGDRESWWQIGKNGRILFDRPKPTVGCSANGRRRRRRRRRRREEEEGDRESWWQIGKNGRTLFDRPKPTVGCSANGRRRRLLGNMNNTVFRGVTPCNLEDIYCSFRGTFCILPQVQKTNVSASTETLVLIYQSTRLRTSGDGNHLSVLTDRKNDIYLFLGKNRWHESANVMSPVTTANIHTTCFFVCYAKDYSLLSVPWPPLWSSGQSFWLQYRGPGFDPRRYQIFCVVVGLERGPLSLVRSIEELLEWKKLADPGLENRD